LEPEDPAPRYDDALAFPDLASRAVRGSVVAASDEFFAEKENLVKPGAPVFSHVRLNIYPDGGVARLRLHGSLTPEGLARLRRR
jgi:allantoicase